VGIDFFREELDWAGARSDVLAWGYPRPVTELEGRVGKWVRYGERVVLWFVMGPEEQTLALHVCAAPEARGHLGTPREMAALEVMAELLGATRLWSVTELPGAPVRMPSAFTRRFLRARGWENCERGSYRNLGVER